MPVRLAVILAFVGLLSGQQIAGGQTLNPGPPGPFVVDVRGVSSGLPTDGLVVTPAAGGAVATRGFGGSLGAHVYAFQLGPARLGAGMDVTWARGTASDTRATFFTLAPQLSVNFGTSDGWSYLSAGLGSARLRVEPGLHAPTARDVNFGGGARWFLRRHFGIGFDVRFHRIAAGDEPGAETPAATAVAVGVGFALK